MKIYLLHETSIRLSKEHRKELHLMKALWQMPTVDHVLERLILPHRAALKLILRESEKGV